VNDRVPLFRPAYGRVALPAARGLYRLVTAMIPVLDGHNDAITSEWHDQLTERRTTGHLDLPRMREGGVRAAFFAIFSAPAQWPENPVAQPDAHGGARFDLPPAIPFDEAAGVASRAAGRLLGLERAGALVVARSAADLDVAHDDLDGPPAAILHLEGAEAIDPGLETLELWYAAGLRSLGPVWSRPTAFGHGVPFTVPSTPDTGSGLTDAGKRLVTRCGELGVMVDLAHLNEAGFWDVARLEAGPLVSSHTAAHALCQSARNLTDAQIDAVGESGGLVGIVYGTRFLRADFSDDPDTPLSLIAEHAAYVAQRIGVEHVALGSDFDGTTIPAPLGDVSGVPRVLDALRAAGFGDDDLAKIAWGNWRRVLGAWWR
jgi:membrane dipeptidase